MLSKDTHRVMALAYARRGYVVFTINYRLGPEHLFPAPLEDASPHALVWVREHCARFGGDPSRLAIAGESAGANLVTALTSRLIARAAPSRSRGASSDADVEAAGHRGHVRAFLDLESASTTTSVTRASRRA